MPATVKADGDVISGTVWNGLIYEQAIMTVPSDSAWPTGTEGQVIYDAETRTIMQYDGSAWRYVFRDWTPFTPVWSNLDLSGDSQQARYRITSGTVHVQGQITFADTTPVSGLPALQLPVTSSTGYGVTAAPRTPVGTWTAFDDSGTAAYEGVVIYASSTSVDFYKLSPAGANYVGVSSTSATVPHTWANGDMITYDFWYPAA